MTGSSDLAFDNTQIADAVSSRRDWAIDWLSRLVREPTVLGSEQSGQRVMAALFEELDLEVNRVMTCLLMTCEAQNGTRATEGFPDCLTGRKEYEATR